MLSKVEKVDNEDWFEEVDKKVFAFKHKVHHWLKQVELEHENGSRSSSKLQNPRNHHPQEVLGRLSQAVADLPKMEQWRRRQN